MLQGYKSGQQGGWAGQAGPSQVPASSSGGEIAAREKKVRACLQKELKKKEIQGRGWAIHSFPPSLLSVKRCGLMAALYTRNAFLKP